jgi:HD-like signal output (HDOD) protein
MTTTIRPTSLPPISSPKFVVEEQERRKVRLMDILSRGLPTLPNYVLDLNVLLSQSTVDLKKVGNVIRTDPSLTSQALKLCNSALFGLRHRVISIEQAAILLGTERLRTLVLTCSVMQFAGKRLPKAQLTKFWHHSFLCALLAERLASHLHYCEKEQAYLGGLLHDIGQLPMWILVIGEQAAQRTAPPLDWVDNIQIEREYFSMDHCKVGRWMGVSWNYMPSFIDVFQYHHAPDRAQHDPYLVGIVAAADQFLIAHSQESAPPSRDDTAGPESAADVHVRDAAGSNPEHAVSVIPPPSSHSPETFQPIHPELPPFLQKCLPELTESEHRALLDMMQTEYLHLVPLVQLGMAIAASDDL